MKKKKKKNESKILIMVEKSLISVWETGNNGLKMMFVVWKKNKTKSTFKLSYKKNVLFVDKEEETCAHAYAYA